MKNAHNALIGVVVLGYAAYWATRGGRLIATGTRERVAFVWATFPRSVLGFLAVAALGTVGFFSGADETSLGNLSRWAFLLCFAGVGLNFDLRAMARSGRRPLLVADVWLVVVAACSLGLALLASPAIGAAP